MLSLVLPKGSLEKATMQLFDAADLTVRRASDRDYRASIDDPRIDRVRVLRPQEIPTYLEQGLFDLGITGRDWITETDSDVVSLGELQYSKATSNPVRVIMAVPEDAPWQSVSELPEGVRISTEFPAMTKRFLDKHGVKAKVVKNGASLCLMLGEAAARQLGPSEHWIGLRLDGEVWFGKLMKEAINVVQRQTGGGKNQIKEALLPWLGVESVEQAYGRQMLLSPTKGDHDSVLSWVEGKTW